MRAALLVMTGALLLAGCGQNAFLELEIDLPPNAFAMKGDRYANVRIVSGQVPFDQDWQIDTPLPAPKLDPSAPTKLPISVEGSSSSETVPVRVKVRFCKSADCTMIGDDQAPEVRLEIERAFYLGKRTSYTWTIGCVPNVAGQTDAPPACDVPQDTATTVPKCKVAGCRTGSPTSGYCVGDKHFCE